MSARILGCGHPEATAELNRRPAHEPEQDKGADPL